MTKVVIYGWLVMIPVWSFWIIVVLSSLLGVLCLGTKILERILKHLNAYWHFIDFVHEKQKRKTKRREGELV